MERSRTSFFIITILYTGFFLSISALSAYGQWAATYGGVNEDSAASIQQTQDGGYIVAGYTSSFGAGYADAWIMKLDSTGAVTWQKTYGGTNPDSVNYIQQTQDGGYIVAGYTSSFGAGYADAWIMKLDSTGAITWQKTYGGANYDYAYSIQQTQDGGYIVAGSTVSFGAGNYDAWIMKLDSTGAVTWQKTYGGANSDSFSQIQQTQDGGYIAAGSTNSFGAGDRDAWIMKLDSTGAVTWQKTYGGTDYDYASSIQQTQDGGYILAGGGTNSFGDGDRDIWVLKLDSTGAITWQKTYGGINHDTAYSIQQTEDGGYIVAGTTNSFGTGNYDLWVIQLSSTGAVVWEKTYGGITGNRFGTSIRQIADGGYIVAGENDLSFQNSSDAFILKLDSSGSIGSCPFEGVLSTAVVSDTTVTGSDTSVVPADTTVNGVDNSAIVSDSSASANQWCPLTEDAQRLKVGTTGKKKGEGRIESAEGLLACPDNCEQEYNKGLMVTLYADPSALSTFLGWKPSSLGCSGTDPCPVTMDKKKSVKAVFQGPNKLKVVTTFKNGGTGTVTSGDTFINCPVDCEELYQLGTSVTLTATPTQGYFVGWTGKPCKDESTNVCTFEMNKNATVKAIFEPNP